MTKTLLYTDGGCAPSNPGPASWGVVLVRNGVETERCGSTGHGTNQIAELQAAIEGLKLVPEGEEVVLRTDSQYVVMGLTVWRRGWERRGWKNTAGKTVANLELWRTLFEAVDRRRVVAEWVKGHNGDRLNERCDALCRQARMQ